MIFSKIELPPELDSFVRRNEPLSLHTTFKVGGPADVYVNPQGAYFPDSAERLIRFAKQNNVPLFVLGGGANVVFEDSGFRGIVLDVTGWTGCAEDNGYFVCKAGMLSNDVAEAAQALSLSGLEFITALPGSIGGAVWMNARCFEKSIADVLDSVEILDENYKIAQVPFNAAEWDYKKSPFQNRDILILQARFKLRKGNQAEIAKTMASYKNERESKGHFRYPSAGSVFKNNRSHGKPAGKIIEELGLRGAQQGGARIADWHGNFIINTGSASAADIRALVQLAQNTAAQKLHLHLEPEIIFVGNA